MARKSGYKCGKSSILVTGNFAYITPSNNKSIVITMDLASVDNFILSRNWSERGRGYLMTRIPVELQSKFAGKSIIYLHEYLMLNEMNVWKNKYLDVKFQVDHCDRQPNNSLLANLRVIPAFANNLNRSNSGMNGSSVYNGVCIYFPYENGDYRWLANFRNKLGKKKHIGYYRTEAAAALAWNEKMVSEFGEELMKPWLNQI
jgi:hypothetical protein